jgi:predicted aspartyl protease
MNPLMSALFLPNALLASLSMGLGPVSVPDTGIPSTTPDLLFASPTRLDHVGRIVVPVTIDGKGPFRFIVDTGASSSTISPQAAITLGLDPAQQSTMVVNGITGTQEVPSVAIGRLVAGDIVIEDTRLPVIWAPLMAGADGILGVAGFRKEIVFVDFQRNRVVISRSVPASDRVGFEKVPAKVLGDGLMAVEGRINGISVRAIIDTGSERSLGNIALREALEGQHNGMKSKFTDVYGATTDIAAGEIRRVPTITLGPVNISEATVVFGDFHIFDVWGMNDRPAVIIGMDVLGTATSLGIDFKRSEVYFGAVERSRDPSFGWESLATHQPGAPPAR